MSVFVLGFPGLYSKAPPSSQITAPYLLSADASSQIDVHVGGSWRRMCCRLGLSFAYCNSSLIMSDPFLRLYANTYLTRYRHVGEVKSPSQIDK